MSIRRKYKKSKPFPQMYVILNKYGQVFTGMKKGYIQWSDNWLEAKPLFKENTTLLLQENKGAELIKEEELI
jgi:hypothetical protein